MANIWDAIFGSAIAANRVLASPNGSAGPLTPRAIVAADLPAGTGTVTMVGFTGGLISVANPTTTPALTVAGTSGGVPYFSSTSAWASSALLAANAVLIGGGAGVAPSSIGVDATTTHALFATAGAPAFRAIAAGDLPSLSSIYLPLAGGTMVGNLNITSGIDLTWNTDSGISRLAPSALAFGKGTDGDFTGQLKAGSLTLTVLGTPATPVVTPTLGTASTWTYKIVAKDINGNPTAAGAAGSTAVGAATLDGTHFNTITWAATPGAFSYDVYRTVAATSPSTLGRLGTVLSTATLTFLDNGVAASPAAVVATTVDGTGSDAAPGGFISQMSINTGIVVGGLRGTTFATNALYPAVMGPTNANVFALVPSCSASVNQTCELDFYQATVAITPSLTWAMAVASNNGSNASFTLKSQLAANGQNVVIAGGLGTSTVAPGVTLGGDGNNAAGQTFQAVSGTTQVGVSVGNGVVSGIGSVGFNPASGASAFTAFQVNPVINQTGTASGAYTALKVNVVETALLGSGNLLLDLQAGATGGTSEFAISNSGVITRYKAVATVGAGVSPEVAAVDLTAQTAAIGTTTLYAVPATGAGLYRVVVYAKITTAGTTSILGGTNGFQLTWTDPTDSTVPTSTIVDLSSGALNANTTTTVYLGSATIAAKASTNIQYAFDYTSTGTTMAYKISIKVEYLG